jgi:hypothetical protein
MTDFLSHLTSVSWWLSVVLVGLLINVFGVYLTRRLDRNFSKTSLWLRSKSRQFREKHARDLAKIENDSHEAIMLGLSELRCRLRSLVYLLAGVMCLAFFTTVRALEHFTPSRLPRFAIALQIALLIAGNASILGFMVNHLQAAYESGLIQEAQTKRPDTQ